MNVLVIGGGPAGMMAAIKAAGKNHHVVLLERNEKLGKKLFITGKGRCNVTNSRDISDFFEFIPRNREFLYSALYTFTNEHLMSFLQAKGLPLKVERGNRVFPVSDKSYDVIEVLRKELYERKVDVRLHTRVVDVVLEGNTIRSLVTDKGTFTADWYIFAGGGSSYYGTGSDGSLHKLIEKAGHTITPLKPSLIPLVLREGFPKELQGLSLKNVRFTLKEGKKELFTEIGEMLFTHFGVSGPLVLSASAYYKGGDATGSIDFKPGLDLKELDSRLQRDFVKYQNKDYKNSLTDLLPSKLIPVIVELSGIDPDKKCNSITKEERMNLARLLKNFAVHINGTKSINEAIITRGGVKVTEIDPSTMKSKIVSNVSFAGEIIDVDAVTGGYNLQIAFSTGSLAGESL
ncbi:NAD(P)/FAD-dependent oxidoreductase [Proteiniclasticum sp. SCR006]|uniref:NAD(P)/FAD-dependent oxidoreductase n=1 Tax=Proteiniclasticum aestuarii TaxID=2817862 RepID=A0A939H8U3_9CLOT|nr:NAD(P)/FAD-dependent oxidoreductase [Proteiniclasticum aestuarii]MBO1263512.1 NAD(P)/FAD-dependent oxidoreductase [Proteiniclasticum aestuarii]